MNIGFISADGFSLVRTGAMVRRYFYVLRSSVSRTLDIVYSPSCKC